MRLSIYSSFLITSFLFACSSSEKSIQQTNKKEPEVYVFDDVTKVDSAKVEKPKEVQPVPEVKEQKEEQPIIKKFIIQVGAFTSNERAQAFVKENQSKIEFVMNIKFKDQVKLYVVQLQSFATRDEAEKVRNNLWLLPVFKDAFILTQE